MPAGPTSTSLSITNPLVLYQSLIASKRLRPDPAQHRLALHLQDLYYRLKDYDPELDYRQRLDQATRFTPRSNDVTKQRADGSSGRFSTLSSLFRDPSPSSILSLTRTVPIQQSALSIQSPQGLLLYGEVGRGKSMLIDLICQALPSSKKRRWHFNTFMLDVFRRLEKARIERMSLPGMELEHVVLSLARDSIATSPILFLDEFQLPDRASSKLLTSFMMSFFHLGGVLVASSNRIPDELAKAQGIEFAPSRTAAGGFLRWPRKKSEGERTAQSDFGVFLEVLKARCEVWEMEGTRDWRREDENLRIKELDKDYDASNDDDTSLRTNNALPMTLITPDVTPRSSDTPPHYHITSLDDTSWSQNLAQINPSQQWAPSTITVYGRKIPITQTSIDPPGAAMWSFRALCAANFGPADYVSIASSTHTLILTDVPVLTLLQKNEARRFITLLDALYESKCRLLIRADAPPDKLFFPETHARPGEASTSEREAQREDDDSVYQESFSEIYQESTAPFRPNVSSYVDSANSTSSILNPSLRSVLADEDADFGPTYGNGRGYGMSDGEAAFRELERRQGPDFTQTSRLTGEDERFAYKRARSRLWEMCGERWWRDREGVSPEEWWRPVGLEGRFWESIPIGTEFSEKPDPRIQVDGSHDGTKRRADEDLARNEKDENLFRHGASPFRTTVDPPPKFGWQHAWGMMTWGKKAGEWGKGVEGDRKGKKNTEKVTEDERERQ